jgi:hypothetical protein
VVEWMDLGLSEEHRKELLREAEHGRLVRTLRRNRRKKAGRVSARSADLRGPVEARWGLASDEVAVADLLQLNGGPRWVAFEERFIVAEGERGILGALRYRTEPKRLVLGLLVADPWAGEERLAKALYGGALELAQELGVKEVVADRVPFAEYPGQVGYLSFGRRWWSPVPRAGGQSLPKGGLRRVLGLWGMGTIPFHRAFHG